MAGLVWGVDRITTLNTVPADSAQAMNANAMSAVLQVEASNQAEANARRTIVIGDAFAAGTGATDDTKSWAAIVAKAQDWHIVNLAHGGTGYLKTSPTGCSGAGCPNFDQMVSEAAGTSPGRVIVFGGQGDFNTDFGQVEPAITKTYADLRAALPNATIIAIGPTAVGSVTQKISDFDAAVQRAAESVGAQYISMIDPDVLDESMTLFGNTQVNDAGQAAIAQRVLSVLPTASATASVG